LLLDVLKLIVFANLFFVLAGKTTVRHAHTFGLAVLPVRESPPFDHPFREFVMKRSICAAGLAE